MNRGSQEIVGNVRRVDSSANVICVFEKAVLALSFDGWLQKGTVRCFSTIEQFYILRLKIANFYTFFFFFFTDALRSPHSFYERIILSFSFIFCTFITCSIITYKLFVCTNMQYRAYCEYAACIAISQRRALILLFISCTSIN